MSNDTQVLRECSNEWYQELLVNSESLFCIHDLEGRLLFTNPAPARLLGYTVEELLRIPMRQLVAPELRTQFDEYLNRIRQTGEDRGLLAVMTKSGERRIWQYHNRLRKGMGAPPVVTGTAVDVTEQKHLESALKASETSYRILLEQTCDGLFLTDSQGRCNDVNPAGAALLGYARREILNMHIADIFVAKKASASLPEIASLLRGSNIGTDWHLRRKDGTVFSAEVAMHALPDGRLQCVFRDRCGHRQTEKDLFENEKRLSGLVESETIAIISVDEAQRITLFNAAAEKLFGCPVAEAVGQSVERLIPELFHAAHAGQIQRYFDIDSTDGGISWMGELCALRLDGRAFPIEVSISKCGNRIVTIILREISDRKQAQDSLLRMERRYRALIRASAQIVWTSAPDGEQHGESMPEWQRFTGQTTEEMSGQGWLNAIHPEDREKTLQVWKSTVAAGCPAEFETRLRRHDGLYRYMLVRVVPVRDSAEKLLEWVGMNTDITEKKLAEEELRRAKEKLGEEKLYLEQEISSVLDGELIGQSKALKEVMNLVAEVASTDATVLLLGETGTGKELIARAVHRMSLRKSESLIKMNCAAIPSGLLESELFGHEKGAFTGAVSGKPGRLELADRGTLFLDEIGEIPLELQPKLLRVLQDQEFERLGSTQTLRVDFRLVAATNRDLARSVTDRQFRSDLYYRINIFPIRLPSLRERREDIPLLVQHFVKKYATKMSKSITSIPRKTMDTLTRWKWPGNIRELENFIERSVILTRGETLEAPLHELLAWTTTAAEETLEAAERRHILLALRDSRGQLSGPAGAAARLGLPRTTLQSKLKQLGIDPKSFRA